MIKKKKRFIVIGVLLGAVVLASCWLMFKFYLQPYYEKKEFLRFQQILEYGSSSDLAEFFASSPRRDYSDFIFSHDLAWEPFYYVAKQSDIEKLRILLENGLSYFSFGGYIDYPVSFSVMVRQPQMIDFLLTSGDADSAIFNPLFDAIGNLLPGKQKYAIYDNLVPDANPRWSEYLQKKQTEDEKVLESIKLFIKYGVGINKQESDWRDTPLMHAAAMGRLDVIELLLHAGADPTIEYKEQTAKDFCRQSECFSNESERKKAIDLLDKAVAERRELPEKGTLLQKGPFD